MSFIVIMIKSSGEKFILGSYTKSSTAWDIVDQSPTTDGYATIYYEVFEVVENTPIQIEL